MKDKYKIVSQVLGPDRVKLDEPLLYHLLNKGEGKADCFYIATSLKELEQALKLAQELKIPFFIFGAGTKVLISQDLEGLTIKNRTSGIKISGVKGKVSPQGIGVEEAMVEVESGVSMQKMNDFLKAQNLKTLTGGFIPEGTIGGSLYIDPRLQDLVQKIKVFSDSQVFDIDIPELKKTDIILSAIFKVKSAI